MRIQITPSHTEGSIAAIESKSVAHRLLICAAFADKKTYIRCERTNKDIEATASCLNALGARIVRNAPYYEVTPVAPDSINKNAILRCCESGSTMRFLVPIAAALGADALFAMEGRLPERPLSPLREELERKGITFSDIGSNPLSVRGRLTSNSFSIAGNVSSQFISGLLFALSLLPYDSTLTVEGKIESAPYIDITTDALALFGASPTRDGNVYRVTARGKLCSPERIDVEGDWSNAAFPLTLGCIGKGAVTVTGLNPKSSQGDAEIVNILRRFGADIRQNGNTYTAYPSRLCGININAEQIPDLVPILATAASVADGTTVISGAARLRIKESDRLQSVSDMLSKLGASITQTPDGLVIVGKKELNGGCVSSFNDHRIAMSAAIASSVCKEKVIVEGAESAAKSYPAFWKDITSLGAICEEI